ncbi:hypothetical protein [Erythrobacter oryzae]|uniref:hypothetical protein n=1 Tax=Erythrobacter oryzae TaxID=3019556 RepID=UPI0025543B66|nr:hypothetical protein [Erythrobacter sp. COR-2]
MSAPFADRWRLVLPLAVPALGGLAYLAAFGAPLRLIAINAGALVAGALWAAFGRLPSGPKARLGLAALGAALLFLPVLIGPEVGGVSRWLPAGPVLLHSGALLLPLVVVLASQSPRAGPPLLGAAIVALALQPDAAMLAGLAAASAVFAITHRSVGFTMVALAALGLAAVNFGRGTLEPQLFTEGVLAQIWYAAPPAALLLGALLFLAAPALLLHAAPLPRTEATALAALLVTLGVMACLAPFPFPLIGYGASPILGLALALSAAGTARHA